MKIDALKSNLSLILLCIAANTLTVSSDVERKNMANYAKLIVALGPERAKKLKTRLEQKHAKKEPSKPIPSQPVKSPIMPQPEVPSTKPAPEQPITIQPPMAPAAPVVKTWVSDKEKEDFNAIVSHLQHYMAKVDECINDFFNKNNNEPYHHHVNCFKTQLKFLQTLLQNYPQAQTPAGNLLFTALKQITSSLEKCQVLTVKSLDRDYPSMNTAIGVITLGNAMQAIQTPVNQQRNEINKQIGILRNELRKAHATEMLNSINKLNQMINVPFDFAKGKTTLDLLPALTNRVKKRE